MNHELTNKSNAFLIQTGKENVKNKGLCIEMDPLDKFVQVFS